MRFKHQPDRLHAFWVYGTWLHPGCGTSVMTACGYISLTALAEQIVKKAKFEMFMPLAGLERTLLRLVGNHFLTVHCKPLCASPSTLYVLYFILPSAHRLFASACRALQWHTRRSATTTRRWMASGSGSRASGRSISRDSPTTSLRSMLWTWPSSGDRPLTMRAAGLWTQRESSVSCVAGHREYFHSHLKAVQTLLLCGTIGLLQLHMYLKGSIRETECTLTEISCAGKWLLVTSSESYTSN